MCSAVLNRTGFFAAVFLEKDGNYDQEIPLRSSLPCRAENRGQALQIPFDLRKIQAPGSKLDVGPESLCRRVVQAQFGNGVKDGPTTA